jgi:hypothetical protein
MSIRAIAVYALSLLAILFVITGCESMEDIFEGTAKELTAGAVSSSAATSGSSSQSDSGILDFKDGEILAAYEGSTWDRANYLVATTLTTATAETKNEGEFLFVSRGSSRWTPFFYETYVPDQSELEIGQRVFFCGSGRSSSSPMDRDSYRKAWWYIGRITELDELFKGVVKINGDPYKVEAIRLPAEPFS